MSDDTFPTRLRQKRKERGLTQGELAKWIHVSPQAVSQWETGQAGADHKNIVALAEKLSVDWNWLGYGANTENPDISVQKHVFENRNSTYAVLCSREEIAGWALKFPKLDVDPFDYIDLLSAETGKTGGYEALELRFASAGYNLATEICTDSMSPMFSRGDIAIFDTGISPIPGDYVLAYIVHNKSVMLRKLRIRTDEGGSKYQELVPLNEDYPVTTIKTPKAGRILGTLIEHRRYRAPPGGVQRVPLHLSKTGLENDT
ncbi:hypothetical protein BHAOGJBA_1729 [Methylobacterium hispanicum]|uniref:HTH cro/C1-type domain-containing protein n=1 Tax=Methylobacterium hispanicum TaxID=270350 RepID=A0AAV4ZJ95_9HYPH|nr:MULTISPECIES: helix-turn-helix domain-containing protein [Methylobacterium]GJD88216.1 hypothetical protein BHAOGJBA_1729 [Methylobacterium hispanicum]